MANGHYSLKEIAAEIALCAPLCRACHMKEDGRLANLKGHRPETSEPAENPREKGDDDGVEYAHPADVRDERRHG
jgi:hypothetical protein